MITRAGMMEEVAGADQEGMEWGSWIHLLTSLHAVGDQQILNIESGGEQVLMRPETVSRVGCCGKGP